MFVDKSNPWHIELSCYSSNSFHHNSIIELWCNYYTLNDATGQVDFDDCCTVLYCTVHYVFEVCPWNQSWTWLIVQDCMRQYDTRLTRYRAVQDGNMITAGQYRTVLCCVQHVRSVEAHSTVQPRHKTVIVWQEWEIYRETNMTTGTIVKSMEVRTVLCPADWVWVWVLPVWSARRPSAKPALCMRRWKALISFQITQTLHHIGSHSRKLGGNRYCTVPGPVQQYKMYNVLV